MTKSKEPHNVLGVSKCATADEIKHAYRKRVLALHPDLSGDASTGEQLSEVRAAYEFLSSQSHHSSCDDHPSPTRVSQTSSKYTRPNSPSESWTQDSRRRIESEPDYPEACVHLEAEYHLSKWQALTGGVFPLDLTLRVPCPRCSSHGTDPWGQPCFMCWGMRFYPVQKSLELVVPPEVTNGSVAALEIHEPLPLRLKIRVRILPS